MRPRVASPTSLGKMRYGIILGNIHSVHFKRDWLLVGTWISGNYLDILMHHSFPVFGPSESNQICFLDMKDPIETCDVKRQLLGAYQKATEAYSQAVAELARQIGIISKADYNALTLASHKARRFSADALEALEAHTDEHGC